MESANTTVAAVKMARKNRTAQDGLIFHCNRGVQYCAQAFRDVLRKTEKTSVRV